MTRNHLATSALERVRTEGTSVPMVQAYLRYDAAAHADIYQSRTFKKVTKLPRTKQLI